MLDVSPRTVADRLQYDRKVLDDAVCRSVDPEIFYPTTERQLHEAVKVCQGCRIADACLLMGLAWRENHGIWGGRTSSERKTLLKQEGLLQNLARLMAQKYGVTLDAAMLHHPSGGNSTRPGDTKAGIDIPLPRKPRRTRSATPAATRSSAVEPAGDSGHSPNMANAAANYLELSRIAGSAGARARFREKYLDAVGQFERA